MLNEEQKDYWSDRFFEVYTDEDEAKLNEDINNLDSEEKELVEEYLAGFLDLFVENKVFEGFKIQANP